MSVAFRMLIVVLAVSVLQLFSGGIAYSQTPQPSFEVFPAPPPSQAAHSKKFTVQILQHGKVETSPVYETKKPTSSSDPPSPSFEETTAWTSFATDEAVTVLVTNSRPFYSARILPSHAGIVATPTGGDRVSGYSSVRFTMSGAGSQQVSVEFCYTPGAPASCDGAAQVPDDIRHPLLVFANPPSGNMPEALRQKATQGQVRYVEPGSPVPPLGNGPAMVYFKPGVHDLGSTPYTLGTGQRAVLAGGAYVKGMFKIDKDAEDAAIEGLGILSGDVCPNEQTKKRTDCPMMIDGSQAKGRVTVSGITIVDSPYYNVKLEGSGNFVSNVKVISWMPNTDGIALGSNSTLSYSFFKTGDDAIKLYSSNLWVSSCTLWQLGNAAAFEMGVNLSEDVSNVTVENSDVIRTEWNYPNRSNAVVSAAFGGNAKGSNYTFRDIRVENANPPGFKDAGLVFQLFKLAVIPNSWTEVDNKNLGSIHNVTFSNIQVTDPTTLPNLFQSFDAQHQVSDVTFDNVTVAEQTLPQPMLTFNANRNFSLSGTVFSDILQTSIAQPNTLFLADVFPLAANGQPTFQPLFSTFDTLSVQGVGDFDGNGYASMLFLDSKNGLGLWKQPLSSQPSFASITDLSSDYEVAGIGDFNGDGRSDILLWAQKASVGLVLLMNGASVIGTIPVGPAASSDWSVAGIGDIDQNGQSDIILRDGESNVEILSFRHDIDPSGITYAVKPFSASKFNYPCSGGGSLRLQKYCPLDQSWQVAGVGDIRGNGYASILWVNQTTGQIVVTAFAFEGPPQRPFGTPFGTMPSGYQIASLGDYNGDGTMDILLFNAASGGQTIWYTGYFGDNIFYQQGPTLAPQPYIPVPYQGSPMLLPPSGNAPTRR